MSYFLQARENKGSRIQAGLSGQFFWSYLGSGISDKPGGWLVLADLSWSWLGSLKDAHPERSR